MSNSAGYDLYEAFENQWVLDFKNGDAFHGTLKEIGFYMCDKLDFYLEDIEFAVETILQNGHNAAHFGIFKSLLFTFTKDLSDKRRAS